MFSHRYKVKCLLSNFLKYVTNWKIYQGWNYDIHIKDKINHTFVLYLHIKTMLKYSILFAANLGSIIFLILNTYFLFQKCFNYVVKSRPFVLVYSIHSVQYIYNASFKIHLYPTCLIIQNILHKKAYTIVYIWQSSKCVYWIFT